jgi:membrane fusion protein, copper/silver efflux system
MKNKSVPPLPALVLAALVGLGTLLLSCGKSKHPATKTLYTCGMHPQVIQDHPGNCPICGMKLTPVRKQPAATTNASAERKIKFYKSTMKPGEMSQSPGKDSMGMDMVPVYEDETTDKSLITIDPATRQSMNLRTGIVTNGPLRRVVRSVGVVDFDETSLAEVPTKYKGWIEKLYVDSTGVQVHRGDPLFEIYSPDLYSAQVEYLLALAQASRAGPESATLRTSARAKLQFFDISDAQIAELEKTKQAKKTLAIHSPRDGMVVEKAVIEGQMVDAGTKLYRLANLSLVWVMAQVYEQDLPLVKVGQDAVVRLSYLPDREFRGRVTYIYPTLDEKTRTAKVRMEFHNPGFFLKPGMFATVELRSELAPSALLVPDTAVLRSGEKNTVFVALDGGRFEARTVTLGPRAENNMYQVLSGLNAGERVVTSGQFLLDSESQLREAIEKLNRPEAQKSTNMTLPGTALKSEPSTGTNVMVYICPMPEHVAIKYDHPGSCPICGMALVPVAEQTLAKLHPGGRVEYYLCPMTDACPTPGHGAVHYEKAGKCPVCGMTLIPVMGAPPTPPASTSPEAKNSSVKELVIPALYTCPMHLDVVSERPGKCPQCEMDLMRTTEFDEGKIAEENWRKQHQPAH